MSNEPAFPVSTAPCTKEDGPGKAGYNFGHQDGNYTWQYSGMTLRDYFAAQVIGHIYKDFWDAVRADKGGFDADWPMGLAMEAYRMADAMLRAREKQ